jgi:hypothetical protein
LNSSFTNEVKVDEMGRACDTHGGKSNAYRILAGKPEGKRSLEIYTHRLENNIKMDL